MRGRKLAMMEGAKPRAAGAGETCVWRLDLAVELNRKRSRTRHLIFHSDLSPLTPESFLHDLCQYWPQPS